MAPKLLPVAGPVEVWLDDEMVTTARLVHQSPTEGLLAGPTENDLFDIGVRSKDETLRLCSPGTPKVRVFLNGSRVIPVGD